jgi:protein-S-isoprenylcysteine O-methyltransferase Ste14
MSQDIFLHRWFIAVLLAIIVVRLSYAVRARIWRRDAQHQRTVVREPWIQCLRVLIALPVAALTIGFMVRPDDFSWMRMNIPIWLRWVGLGQCIMGLVGLVWIHHHLGKNFSTELRIRADHRLVMSGPYRYVRHPMYANFLLWLPGLPFLGDNWVLLVFFLFGLFIVVTVRIPAEERMLLASFGDQYQEYMRTTGGLLPRLNMRNS